MNGHFFPLFISISENESFRNLTNNFLVKSWFFCKRSKRLPSVNIPYDSSFHMLCHVILQQPLETKWGRLRDLLKIAQLKSSWVTDTQSHVLPIIWCWLLRQAEATHVSSENIHMIGSAYNSSLPHFICPLRRMREKERFLC